jgi:class 3 adenylate cyclase
MRTNDFRDWAGAAKATVALVFTDIVGSTVLANELGNEAMDQVRQTHFEEGRRWLRKFGGYEIKTIGDSLMVAFRTAVEALDFSLEFARQTGHPRVSVRAGLHVGQIHIKEGDAFGSMVNYSARVVSHAEGAEIWVSDRGRDDVIEEKAKSHEGLHWEEHQSCELKGFPGTHTLWSVRLP